MADDRKNPGPEDGKRISLAQEHEVRYWTQALGLSRAELRAAVAAVGNSALAVKAYVNATRPDPDAEPVSDQDDDGA